MKLYFYIFNNYSKKLSTGEAEVVEKPKTYKPVNKFPAGFYGSYVKKEDIGHLSGYRNNIVVLTEDKPEVAIDMILQKHKRAVSRAIEEVEEQKSIVDYLENCKKNCTVF